MAGSTVIKGQGYYQDEQTLYATFDLAGASANPGIYDLVVINPNLESASRQEGLTVLTGGQPQ